MFRRSLIAIVAATSLALSGCSSTPKPAEFNEVDFKADQGQIIANQIEGVSSQWHNRPIATTWFGFEREFGGVHGLSDLKLPSQHGKTLCQSQGGRFYFVKSDGNPRSDSLRRDSNVYMFTNLRDSFGLFSCLKDGIVEWSLLVSSTNTQRVEDAGFLVSPPYKTTVLFTEYRKEMDSSYVNALKNADINNLVQLRNFPDGTLNAEEMERYEPLRAGQKVCTRFEALQTVGYVQSTMGEQVIVYILASVTSRGRRSTIGGYYRTGRYWDFAPCNAWVNSPY